MIDEQTTDSLLEYVSKTRFCDTPEQIANELERLGRFNPAWPRCSSNQWMRIIQAAIVQKKLVLNDAGHVGPSSDERFVQASLFEDWNP